MKLGNFFILIFFLLSTQNSSLADIPHFLDFKYILNSSDAGKKAQVHLKKKLENGIKNISSKEKSILGVLNGYLSNNIGLGSSVERQCSYQTHKSNG